MSWGRVEISGGALLAAALLYYLDSGGIFLWALLACALHELGHWWAIRALGGRIRYLRLSCAGAELRLSAARPLPPGKMLLAALAGPGMNLLLAMGSAGLARHGAGERLYLFAGLNLGLTLFNLLPAGWLDGGRALENLLALLGREELGRRSAEICSIIVALLLLGAGCFLLWESGGQNFTLLIAGLWMTQAARREQWGQRGNLG
ncbi:site-2 protease family protein [Vermiculatibacterium agrestimuris]|uniref:site-2 protease family protein n=1 Tax=Vermiculatibacterium agrestimuris TaxID=2941519 RepID=UPI00203CDCF8|nr:site-2 protease family protein [Vermiculatibacterium agrestimuris]